MQPMDAQMRGAVGFLKDALVFLTYHTIFEALARRGEGTDFDRMAAVQALGSSRLDRD